MFDLNGKYTTARIFTNNVENEALSQIYELCNQEFVKGCKVRIMPDVHAGKGCTIGTTMEIKDKVVPNLVGVDILYTYPLPPQSSSNLHYEAYSDDLLIRQTE